MSLMLSGTGVSRGITIGKVRLVHEIQHHATASHINPRQVSSELQRVRKAMDDAISELDQLQSHLRDKLPANIMSFFNSHLMMLRDKALSQPVMELIEKNHYTSEWALAVQRDRLMSLFDRIEDPYLHQRAEDVENVIAKVLQKLSGTRDNETQRRKNYIVITRTLAPADVIAHHQDGMRGLVCTHGGPMSHAAIVARSLRIPTIVGARQALRLLREDDELILDGDTGMLVASPDSRSIRHYRDISRAEKKRQKALRAQVDKPTVSVDGVAIELLANVESTSEAAAARRAGAAGVGLFRTEVLYLNRDDLPDEKEQLQVYRRLVRAMHGKPVTVRTMDIWAGGEMRALPPHIQPPQTPALGQRGVRLCLAHPEIFEPQLRAMLRASGAGPLRILLPMITTLAELRECLDLIDDLHEQLQRRYRVAERVPVGVLVEVPAVALACRMFAPHVDFLAIGSNDLAQYTLALDRDDDQVQSLYDPLHPAVLRLIREVVMVGERAEKPVVLCGELGSDARICRLLLGLGLRHLSVHPGALLEVRNTILQTNIADIESRARRALRHDSPAQTQRLLRKLEASSIH